VATQAALQHCCSQLKAKIARNKAEKVWMRAGNRAHHVGALDSARFVAGQQGPES
jgi:hypothetical protein